MHGNGNHWDPIGPLGNIAENGMEMRNNVMGMELPFSKWHSNSHDRFPILSFSCDTNLLKINTEY